jgi:hypothetical protein
MARVNDENSIPSCVNSTYEPAQGTSYSNPTYQYVSDPYLITLRTSTDELGYSLEGFLIKLAIGTLLLYCLVVLIFFTYSVATGISSSCWDTIAEVVALALNSERPIKLQHTTAGIETMDTFRHPISICATEEDRLGIIFRDDRQEQVRETKKVIVNWKY